MSLTKNIAGDTIVEVLIVLAVMSTVIAASIVTSNNSLRGSQLSHERAEALKYAESQLELLRSQVSSPEITALGQNVPFCIITSATPVVSSGWTPAADAPNNHSNFETDPLSAYPADCREGPDDRYHIFVIRLAAGMNKFAAHVRWSPVGGGREEVRLMYEVY